MIGLLLNILAVIGIVFGIVIVCLIFLWFMERQMMRLAAKAIAEESKKRRGDE